MVEALDVRGVYKSYRDQSVLCDVDIALDKGSFTSVLDLRTKLLNFIAYFNRVFANPFRWTYTGRPLMKAAA